MKIDLAEWQALANSSENQVALRAEFLLLQSQAYYQIYLQSLLLLSTIRVKKAVQFKEGWKDTRCHSALPRNASNMFDIDLTGRPLSLKPFQGLGYLLR